MKIFWLFILLLPFHITIGTWAENTLTLRWYRLWHDVLFSSCFNSELFLSEQGPCGVLFSVQISSLWKDKLSSSAWNPAAAAKGREKQKWRLQWKATAETHHVAGISTVYPSTHKDSLVRMSTTRILQKHQQHSGIGASWQGWPDSKTKARAGTNPWSPVTGDMKCSKQHSYFCKLVPERNVYIKTHNRELHHTTGWTE